MRKKIVLKNKYMQKDFCELMKQKQWSAGVPSVVKQDSWLELIVFPALDTNHQVQIQLADGALFNKPRPNNIIYVQVGREALDMGKAVARSTILGHFGFIGELARIFSPNHKKAKELLLQTIKELEASGF